MPKYVIETNPARCRQAIGERASRHLGQVERRHSRAGARCAVGAELRHRRQALLRLQREDSGDHPRARRARRLPRRLRERGENDHRSDDGRGPAGIGDIRTVKWWMRSVGAVYLLMFVMAAVIRLPIRTLGPAGVLDRAAAGDPTARLLVDTWVTLGLEFVAVGVALLIAANFAVRAAPLVGAILGVEVVRGIGTDVYMIARGYQSDSARRVDRRSRRHHRDRCSLSPKGTSSRVTSLHPTIPPRNSERWYSRGQNVAVVRQRHEPGREGLGRPRAGARGAR